MGRFLGKAIYDVQLVDLPFCTALYRHLLGQPVGIPELEEMDEVSPPPPYLLPPLHLVGLLTSTYPALPNHKQTYAKSLEWITNNDITGGCRH